MIARVRRFFAQRVARRLFLLFVLSAFLPLAVIAALSLSEVRSLLLQQGEQRLAAIAKAYGMTLFERLLVANDLAATAASGTGDDIAQDRLARRAFDALTLIEPDGKPEALIGPAMVPALSNGVRNRLEAGKPAVLVQETGRVARVLLMAESGHGERHLVVAALNTDYLWGTDDERPNATDFCVIEEKTGNVLHCTAPIEAGTWRAVLARKRSSLGTASWDRDGRTYRAVAWPQFLGARFGTHDWIVVATQPEAYQLVRAVEFRRLYIPVVLLTLLLVTWLTVRQARNIVVPIGRLAAWARGVAQNQFDRLELKREDEFGELAGAFDQMTQRLGRQVAALTALSEIDRLILSTVETSQVIRSVQQRLGDVVAADAVTVTLIEHDDPSHARTYHRDANGDTAIAVSRHSISAAERETLEAAPAGHWVVVTEPALGYLAEIARAGSNAAYVQPVVWRGTLCGALALGYRNASSLGEDERRQARELADRMAVAVSSVWRDEQLYLQAHFDALTALPNRLLFRDRLGQEIARSEREALRFALLFLDLDHFKTVNDSFGHTTGDAVLREAARRIARCVRGSDTVARLGGDEFTILLTNLNHAQEAWLISETIVEALSKEFDIAGQQCFLSASIGIASFPEDGSTPEELLKSADTAMYRAKASGRAQAVYFEEKMNVEAVARLTLDRDLRVAIERGELELHYQPKVDLASGLIRSAEALVRWRHPTLGLIAPARFIPLAEESGFIEQVGHWTLRQACQQMRQWRARGFDLDSVAVNVSPRQFRRRGLLHFIRECLAQAQLPAACIEIEITEGLLVERGAAIEELLDALRAMGMAIALDDFGTGFSSMSYLKRFPVRTIKIDRVFIEGLEQGADSEAIVAAIIAMSHALGKRVVAEGVETPAQLALLKLLRCDEIQGFLVSQALPPEEFERFVSEREVAPALA